MTTYPKHPCEQDGLISGKYLDRLYPGIWYTADRVADYERQLAKLEQMNERAR